MQIDSGDKYHLLKPTFLIGILDFKHFEGEKYLSNHATLDEETYENILDDIKYTFIELPKFKLKSDELKTLIEKWIFFIKEAENLDVIPENTDDEGLIEAYKDADKHSWEKEELVAYDNAFIAERDEIGRIELAKEQGKEEHKVQAVLGLHSNKIPISIIASSLNITELEVTQIIENNTD